MKTACTQRGAMRLISMANDAAPSSSPRPSVPPSQRPTLPVPPCPGVPSNAPPAALDVMHALDRLTGARKPRKVGK